MAEGQTSFVAGLAIPQRSGECSISGRSAVGSIWINTADRRIVSFPFLEWLCYSKKLLVSLVPDGIFSSPDIAGEGGVNPSASFATRPRPNANPSPIEWTRNRISARTAPLSRSGGRNLCRSRPAPSLGRCRLARLFGTERIFGTGGYL
uniref:Uncharacterized protein n=1 Tax=Odontella aurita TaxID=265563 RepID=A0A7S4IG24_9STRA